MKSNPKYNLPGIAQHVVIRGKGTGPCFSCDEDYQQYLDSLKKVAGAYKCKVHAYVLMPDHVHMIVTPQTEFGISNMLQSLTRRYTRYMRVRHNRTEAIWQKNYKSSLIDDRNYLFACMCYIEVNPVRAKIVDVPSQYKWSSYRANAYNMGISLLEHHPMYAGLGDNSESRCKAYLRIISSRVEVGSVHSIRNALHQELALGSNEFKSSVEQMIKHKDHLSRAEKIIAGKRAA